MALFEVAFTSVPNAKAQEAGAEETVIVPVTVVVASTAQEAIAKASAANAEKIAGATGKIASYVRQFPLTG